MPQNDKFLQYSHCHYSTKNVKVKTKMNVKAVLTFTFLVQFGNYAEIGENIVELVKQIGKTTPFPNPDTPIIVV